MTLEDNYQKEEQSMKRLISSALLISLIGLPLTLAAQETDPCVQAKVDAERDTEKLLWMAMGCVFGCLGVGAAYVIETSPEAMSLVGKSPEYVAAYTDCYKEKGRSIQTNKALVGCLVGTLVGAAVTVGTGLIGGIFSWY